MADFREVANQIVDDEKAFTIPRILQRNGKPYLAADGSNATVTVLGSESKRYKQVRNAAMRKAAESGADEVEASAMARIESAAGVVTAWHGWGANGAEPACTPENVGVLLTVEHILNQVENGIQRRTDFFGDGSTS